MAFMNWDSKYFCGIEVVDKQHEHLFELVNELHSCVVQGANIVEVGKILNSLIEYTVDHFATEERLFAQYGYPSAGDHKAEHDDLTRQVLILNEKFEAKEITISFDVLDFLNDWLKKHTTDSDMKFAAFLKASGKVKP
jgi:hemerythrin